MLVVASLAAIALARQPSRKSTHKASRRRARHSRAAKSDGWNAFDANSSIMRL
jgi:hypothetical protein